MRASAQMQESEDETPEPLRCGTCEPDTLTAGHVYGGEIVDFDPDFDLDFDWSFLLCPQWGMGRTE
jgi:hypothetical protein